MTKSEIFKEAHRRARRTVREVGDYAIAFKAALESVYLELSNPDLNASYEPIWFIKKWFRDHGVFKSQITVFRRHADWKVVILARDAKALSMANKFAYDRKFWFSDHVYCNYGIDIIDCSNHAVFETIDEAVAYLNKAFASNGLDKLIQAYAGDSIYGTDRRIGFYILKDAPEYLRYYSFVEGVINHYMPDFEDEFKLIKRFSAFDLTFIARLDHIR